MYLFNVTKVPVSFLHRRRAISSLFGSSLRKASSRHTFSISHVKIPRKFCCNVGNRIFNSATILLKFKILINRLQNIYEKFNYFYLALLRTNAMSSTADILTRVRLLMTSPLKTSTDPSRSARSFSNRITSCL